MALNPMIQLLGMKQLSYPTQVGLDRETLVPRTTFTAVNVRCRRILFTKAQISQSNRFAIITSRERTKGVIGLIGSRPSPIDHFTRIVDQPSQLDADDP